MVGNFIMLSYFDVLSYPKVMTGYFIKTPDNICFSWKVSNPPSSFANILIHNLLLFVKLRALCCFFWQTVNFVLTLPQEEQEQEEVQQNIPKKSKLIESSIVNLPLELEIRNLPKPQPTRIQSYCSFKVKRQSISGNF